MCIQSNISELRGLLGFIEASTNLLSLVLSKGKKERAQAHLTVAITYSGLSKKIPETVFFSDPPLILQCCTSFFIIEQYLANANGMIAIFIRGIIAPCMLY